VIRRKKRKTGLVKGRYVASEKEWLALYEAKLGPCRVCGRGGPAGIGCSLHHLVPKSQLGDDVAGNLVPLCGSGTTGCHGHVENRSRFHRSILRGKLTEEERDYVIGRQGEGWFDRHYPDWEDA
jgi:hypothetical protein